MTTTAHPGCATMNETPLRSDAQLALPLQVDEATTPVPEDVPLDAAMLDGDSVARASALDLGESFTLRTGGARARTELLTRRCCRYSHRRRDRGGSGNTFTRKAAAEMKDRLLQALALAAARIRSDSQLRSRIRCAQCSCAAGGRRDRALGWELAANPTRSECRTIDALACRWLGRSNYDALCGNQQVTERAEPLL